MEKSIFFRLSDQISWEGYFCYKQEKHHLTRYEERDLRNFINNREYLVVVEKLKAGGHFSYPEKKLIRKMHTDKKRTVYTFPREENYVLKFMTFMLLRKYDYVLQDNLYSFRTNYGVRKAMAKLLSIKGLSSKYSYKVDISNYFNSINVGRMTEMLDEIMSDEPEILRLLKELLNNPYVIDGGSIICEEKGVMAGTPFAVFLANIYLTDLDKAFKESGCDYARYSDDIIIFADTHEELEMRAESIRLMLDRFGLKVNEKKEIYSEPGQPWSFLGIEYNNGTVNVSPVSKEKLKAKIRRRARSIKRWQVKKDADSERAVKAFLRAMNRKFFDPDSSHELTWSRWYFPLISTDETLHEIDLYVQDWARYLAVGTHSKKRYSMNYDRLKDLGYISLVNEYWKYRKECNNVPSD